MAEVSQAPDAAVPVSVIIPVLKEEPGLAQSLEQAAAAFTASEITHEVIVAAAEPSSAPAVAAGLPSARFVTHANGASWGSAILAAGAQAQHDAVCAIGADTLYAAAEIPRLVRALVENDAAMVVGVRIGKRQPIPAPRRFLPWFIDMLASDALGMPALDLNSSLRLFRRAALCAHADRLSARAAPPALLSLILLTAGARVMYMPLDENPLGRGQAFRGLGETPRLLSSIISTGLTHARLRTVSLIVRMTLMLLMMLAMGVMMLWMLGALPGF